jgi:hypothetical protein
VLARLNKPKPGEENLPWTTDHSVRFFKRTLLMRDPEVEKERAEKKPEPPKTSVQEGTEKGAGKKRASKKSAQSNPEVTATEPAAAGQ